MFATLVNDNDGRMVSDTNTDLNYKAEQLIAELEPSIKHKWTNHFFSSLAGWDNMNKGIHQSFFFNKNNLDLFPLEWKEIVKESYQLLTEQGFTVLQDEGLFNIDIFDISSLICHLRFLSIQIIRFQTPIKLPILLMKRVSFM